MAIIDPEGLFNGDRLRRCSNIAQLHWPRLYLASDGFGRIELNYAKIIGRAYSTFSPHPSETELQAWIQEYAKNYLLFVYNFDDRLWGQWDTRKELLPRYKTSQDRRTPAPPEIALSEWKRRYRDEYKAFPKCFENLPETFLHGVGVGVGIGVGKNICASDDARVFNSLPSIDDPPFGTTEPDALFTMVESPQAIKPTSTLPSQGDRWFTEWWSEYWLRRAKKAAREAFRKKVKTEARFHQVMAATRAQKPEMLAREDVKRPHGATWLNGERWDDEATPARGPRGSGGSDDYPVYEVPE